jgi:hypothetical protein
MTRTTASGATDSTPACTTATADAGSCCEGTRPFAVLALEPGAQSGWRLVGRFADFDAAIEGRIADVLTQLEANDGWLTRSEHLVVGPDLDGSVGVWPQTTSLGADPGSDRIPAPYDRAAWRQWLLQTHHAVG